jgi:uncharacterized membrane protein
VLLTIVVTVHIAAGLTAVACGIVAMLAPKRVGRHPRFGRIYLLALSTVTATAVVLAVARPHAAFLLILGAVALTAAGLGFLARRVRWRGWLPHHITGMAVSYVVMLTAFYVDNGPRLPLWELLPPVTFWFLPAAVGLPVLVRALRRHTRPPRSHTRHVKEPTP